MEIHQTAGKAYIIVRTDQAVPLALTGSYPSFQQAQEAITAYYSKRKYRQEISNLVRV